MHGIQRSFQESKFLYPQLNEVSPEFPSVRICVSHGSFILSLCRHALSSNWKRNSEYGDFDCQDKRRRSTSARMVSFSYLHYHQML